MRRERVYAVVAPVAIAGERGDGHQLDRSDAELAQPAQVLDHGVERSLRRERPDVQLVEDEVVERELRPWGDVEARRVDDPRRSEDPLRLVARAGIGPRVVPAEDVPVIFAGSPRQVSRTGAR